MKLAAPYAESPMTDATDKSMLRVSITSICPTATIIRSAASMAIAVRFSPPIVRGFIKVTGITTAAMAQTRPIALRDDATGEGDDTVALVRRRLVATAFSDRVDVGVHIRRCA